MRAAGCSLTVAAGNMIMQWDIQRQACIPHTICSYQPSWAASVHHQELLVEADVTPVFSMAGRGRTSESTSYLSFTITRSSARCPMSGTRLPKFRIL
eukprot:scaffold41400_cov24-Prasinocladus_malaysianus.AAC.1